ncbi:hypothetical protein LIPSTDRAFT_187168 [Lipomyces starkeyi NRRL Y-11557]|uniref:Uncharacterized protein n=1 Tax=Lipomyces starkeyi NRRL Y-11557 TaxID=675824 RepID=A0A1E3PVX5_LIPST|nr:hypothetical protein LIPSTDRAFT_187168 [Lipomyces starkeyi NRRL Y-11557]
MSFSSPYSNNNGSHSDGNPERLLSYHSLRHTAIIMDRIPTGLAAVAVNNPHTLYVGIVFKSVGQARQFVNAYAIHHNFAVKNGFVKNKDQTLLLLCKCAKKLFNSRSLPIAKGTTGSRVIETLEACFVTVLGKSASKSSSMTHGSLRSSLKNIVDTSSKV